MEVKIKGLGRKGDDLNEFNIGLWTNEQTISMVGFMFEVDPTVRQSNLGNLRNLDWTGWIWETPITSWNSAILDGKETAETIPNAGIADVETDLKVNQSIRAWTHRLCLHRG